MSETSTFNSDEYGNFTEWENLTYLSWLAEDEDLDEIPFGLTERDLQGIEQDDTADLYDQAEYMLDHLDDE